MGARSREREGKRGGAGGGGGLGRTAREKGAEKDTSGERLSSTKQKINPFVVIKCMYKLISCVRVLMSACQGRTLDKSAWGMSGFCLLVLRVQRLGFRIKNDCG